VENILGIDQNKLLSSDVCDWSSRTFVHVFPSLPIQT